MFDRFISAVIDTLLAIPPIRFVMGLVESRWRPLWAALWIAVILYLLSRTMNQLALRRARLRILTEPHGGREPRAPEPMALSAPIEPVGAARTRDDVPPTVADPARQQDGTHDLAPVTLMARLAMVPIPVLAGAFVVAAFAVAAVAMVWPAPNDTPATPVAAAPEADSVVRPDAPIDIRYRSGRMEGDHCIGTFEVTHGRGQRAQLVAFVMDTSGAVIGRDSARVASAVPGIFVDFRFRYVECDEIDNWQMQATTTPRSR